MRVKEESKLAEMAEKSMRRESKTRQLKAVDQPASYGKGVCMFDSVISRRTTELS